MAWCGSTVQPILLPQSTQIRKCHTYDWRRLVRVCTGDATIVKRPCYPAHREHVQVGSLSFQLSLSLSLTSFTLPQNIMVLAKTRSFTAVVGVALALFLSTMALVGPCRVLLGGGKRSDAQSTLYTEKQAEMAVPDTRSWQILWRVGSQISLLTCQRSRVKAL